MLPACFDIVAMVAILYQTLHVSGQNQGHFHITIDDHGTTTWFLIQRASATSPAAGEVAETALDMACRGP
jgi:hypothetical protein